MKEFDAAAEKFHNKIFFMWVDMTEQTDSYLTFSIRVDKEELPTIRMVNMQTTNKYKFEDTTEELKRFKADALGEWIDMIYASKVEPFIMSEDPIEGQTGIVKEIVGTEFVELR